MGVERSASVVWEGNLLEGNGVVTAGSSGAFVELPVTWPSRTETPGGKTSPEELIAAAHAACFAMSLSHELTGKGHPPARLDVAATSSGHLGETGWQIDSMDLEVTAEVPGIDSSTFDEALAAAEQGCPVSRALRGGIEIRVKGSLRS
ncbi:MAG: OsmC family peroxiredoxin [Actinomycetota bacterium]